MCEFLTVAEMVDVNIQLKKRE